MKVTKFKLPDKLALALAEYYIKRGAARSHSIGGTYSDGKWTLDYSKERKWNKENLLTKVAKSFPENWDYYASSCGTFWVIKDKNLKLEITENSWPFGKLIE